jgi:hypothetical protein
MAESCGLRRARDAAATRSAHQNETDARYMEETRQLFAGIVNAGNQGYR